MIGEVPEDTDEVGSRDTVARCGDHPATGVPSLLLGSMVIKGIVGLSEDKSSSLLARLLEHTTSAPYTYAHRWGQGDLVVWDNRAVLHTASPCESTRQRRLLYRTSVR